MKYKTVFDVKSKTTDITYYIPLILFFISFAVFLYLVINKNIQASYQISLAIVTICLLILSVISITQVIADYMYLVEPYRKNQSEQIEGIISNLVFIQHTARAESFEVSGLKFVFPNSSTKIGYRSVAVKGGSITKEGMNVRITYIYNEKLGNDNIILKLEVEDNLNKEKNIRA